MLATVLGALSTGFVQTLKLFAITLIGALPLGLIISFGSMSRWAPFARLGNRLEAAGGETKFTRFCEWFKPISLLIKIIVWIVRGTPLMLQLIIIFYIPGQLLPGGSPWPAGDNGRFIAAAVAFIFNYACYFSEIYRGGIESISKGQYEAGYVLGLTKSQIFKKIILKQVIQRIVPPMSNEIITLIKDTALANCIMVCEIVKNAKELAATKALVWPLFFTGVFYLIFVGILTVVLGKVEKKLSYFRS